MTTVPLAPGAFIASTADGLIAGRWDAPDQLFTVTPALAAHLLRADTIPDPQQRAAAARSLERLGPTIAVPDGARPSGDVPETDALFGIASTVGAFDDIDAVDPEFCRLSHDVDHLTMTSVPMRYALYVALKYVTVNGIKGDIVECGVWRGGSMVLAASTLLSLGSPSRTLFLYDCFEEEPLFNPHAERDLRIMGSGPGGRPAVQWTLTKDAATTEDAVRRRVTATGYPPDRIRLVRGSVEQTLTGQPVPPRIAVLRLDTDHYESTRAELVHLYPALVPGGVLILDDYGKLSGATAAVDEYVAGLAFQPLMHRIDRQGRLVVKVGD